MPGTSRPSEFRFALVGCGRISKRHAELLGLGHIDGAKLAAVCDLDASKAKSTGERFKVPHFTDMHQMMKTTDVDAVVILTPSGMHAAHTLDLAPYKKHLIVEKPMALTLTDADRMIAAARKNGIHLFVIKQNRFNVPVVRLRQELDSGRFGRLVMGTVRVRWNRDQSYYNQDSWRGTWALDGGVFTNQASHHVDLLQWMMGDVESVFAKSDTFLVKTETEDTGIAVLKFKNGALGVIEATTACRPKDLEGSLSIMGEGGTVEISGFAVNEMRHWNFKVETQEDQNIVKNYSVNPPNVYGYGHKAYYDHVIEVLRQGGGQAIDGAEGRKSLELITAIYESIESKSEIKYPFTSEAQQAGTSAVIAKSAVVFPNVRLGKNTIIEDFCIIGAALSDGSQPETVIGDNARIRSHTVIYAGNQIGHGFQTGNKANIRELNKIGDNVSIGTMSIIEHHVVIEDGVRIHSAAFIPEHSVLKRNSWVGPHVVFTNAKVPLSADAKTNLKGPTLEEGAIIGANSTLSPGVVIGKSSLIGSGSNVTADIPAGSVAFGNPARRQKDR